MSRNLKIAVLSLCLAVAVAAGAQTTGSAAEPNYLSDALKEGPGSFLPSPDKALNVTRLGVCDTPGTAFGVAVQGPYAYVADDLGGLRIIDISDPATPHEVGALPTVAEVWDVWVGGEYAFLANWSNGLVVVDISNPGMPSTVGKFSIGGNAFAVTVSEGFAYVVDEINGLTVFDVSDPANAVSVGFLPQVSFEDVVVRGDYAYVADFYSGLHVLDVSDPTAPFQVGAYPMPSGAAGVTVDGQYAYLTSFGTSELYVVNIADPAQPVLAGKSTTRNPCINVAVSGGFAYVADWFAGLTVMDVSDAAAPTLVGFSDPNGFAWGVATADDLIYLASGQGGLEIHRNDLLVPELEVTLTPHDAPVTVPAEGGSFIFDVLIRNRTAIVKVASVRLEAELPDGSVRRLRTVSDVIFGPEETLQRFDLSQSVPAGAPAGAYVFRCLVGNIYEGILDTDDFPVEKLGVGKLGDGAREWTLAGWDDPLPAAERAVAPAVLQGAYPNPFNPSTTLEFGLTVPGRVHLAVYDLAGRLVKDLVAGQSMPAGSHKVQWDGRDRRGGEAAAGIYFYRLEVGSFTETRRMLLAK